MPYWSHGQVGTSYPARATVWDNTKPDLLLLVGGGKATMPNDCDHTPPIVKVTAPNAPFTLATSLSANLTVTDDLSGASNRWLRERTAAWNNGYTAWKYPSLSWEGAAALTNTITHLVPGTDYCFTAQADDNATHFSVWAPNYSAWTPQRCAAVPLDDRSLTLATTHWSRTSSARFWNGTATQTTTLGARLIRSGVQAHRLAIVATRCPTCGQVGLWIGATYLGRINLASSRVTYRAILALPPFASQTGTLTIKVLSYGKLVQIDGVGIAHS
jgi:hypothetical protein